jgi:hypothetical protein
VIEFLHWQKKKFEIVLIIILEVVNFGFIMVLPTLVGFFNRNVT